LIILHNVLSEKSPFSLYIKVKSTFKVDIKYKTENQVHSQNKISQISQNPANLANFIAHFGQI
jgi:hypothetical protein